MSEFRGVGAAEGKRSWRMGYLRRRPGCNIGGGAHIPSTVAGPGAVAVSKVRLERVSPLARVAGWLQAARAREAGKISTRWWR